MKTWNEAKLELMRESVKLMKIVLPNLAPEDQPEARKKLIECEGMLRQMEQAREIDLLKERVRVLEEWARKEGWEA